MSEHPHIESLGSTGSIGLSQRSIVTGVKKTVLFFTPSLTLGLVAPFVFPALRRAIRPAAKGLIKGALELSESVKEAASAGREQVSDLMAEVRFEREQEAQVHARPEEKF
jgi:hypothetical protein